jgi:23S rRNA pseudouridine1911/1915/1917 synthase
LASSITQTPDGNRQAEDADGLAEDGELERRSLVVPAELAGRRLDQALAELLPEFSRSRLQAWIKRGLVTRDGVVCRSRDRVLGGERVDALLVLEDEVEIGPQPIPLRFLHRDEDLLVIDKPPGLVVHPAAGNRDGTLQNGLLYFDSRLARIPRCGIVHRLDKDTSGLLVVARSLRAHSALVAQLQSRTMKREYLAVVTGVPVGGAKVDAPIGRHPTQRTRMAVVPTGKPAVTHFRVAERFRGHSLLQVRLETGRTHQIRVHLAYVRYPILGDPVYGGRLRVPAGATDTLAQTLRGFRRQALHAVRLSLEHPVSGAAMTWESPLPSDLARLLVVLREDAGCL